MATFGGTTQKCKSCEKTVYLVDQLTADNKVYHKACFRCHHCKGTLKLSNYSSFEGVLYCKPHFDQLFKMTGSLDKSFEGTPKTVRVDRSADQDTSALGNIKSLGSDTPILTFDYVLDTGTLEKIKSLGSAGNIVYKSQKLCSALKSFYHTIIKVTNSRVSSLFAGTQDKCVACKKTVYPIEKVAVDGTCYHKACFRCTHGGCIISPSNYVAHEQRLYCRHHHNQLFKQKGNFSQLDKHEEVKGISENNVA